MKKTAIVLFNLGGPDKLSSVKPFLFNLFFDKAIINLPGPLRYFLAKFISGKRAAKSRAIYEKIGGKSPIVEITNNLAENVEKELSFSGNFKVFVSMRYWHPMAPEVVKKIKEYGANEVIMLPLYPQFSTTTTESSFNDFSREVLKQKLDVILKKICCYPQNNKFIQSHAQLILKTIKQAESEHKGKYRLLFSAHGLPQKIIDQGDPYCFQINLSTEAIVAEIKQDKNIKNRAIDYQICYQSRVGRLQWTKPAIDDEITRAARDKVGVIIIPIAFTSDHSETLVELDMDYREIAKELNVPFYYRVPALNSDGYFVQSLVEMCKNISNKNQICANDSGSRICPAEYKRFIFQ